MIGTRLSHFQITAKLGEGGMGEVYRADDTKLGRQVAIKVLPEVVASDPERLARFEREAKLLASLNHPRIAAIYSIEAVTGYSFPEELQADADQEMSSLSPRIEVGEQAATEEAPRKVHFLVMELAEGEDLAERIRRGAIPFDEALPIALQIAEALEAAHARGIIHRDLKPANVKVSEAGEVKVLDFGLAKALESGSDPQRDASQSPLSLSPLSLSPTLTQQMTQAGIILGTAAYMAPEQARGKNVDKRADLWAFGCVLYEMLTGQHTFAGETVTDIIASLVAREPDWEALPADTPRPVLRLLRRCLEKDPKQRLNDAGDARLELEQAIRGEQDLLPSGEWVSGTTVESRPQESRSRWLQMLPWALVALFAVGSMALWWARPTPTRNVSRVPTVLGEGALHDELGTSVVLSPDGRQLAFVMYERSGERTLYLRPLDRLEPIRITGAAATGSDSQAPYHPFFSPDSQWLGFAIPSEIKKVPVTGGTPITLCKVRGSRGASWGPDGRIVLAPEGQSGLFTVPDSGGDLAPLTRLEEGREIGHRWPQVLPGGKAALFTVGTTQMTGADDAEIWVVDLATGERKKLMDGGYSPRYVPTGDLLFVREATVFAVGFDLDRLEITGAPAPVLQGVDVSESQGGAQFTVADDGTLVYVGGGRKISTYPVVWVDRDGRTTPLWSEPGAYGVPRMSPDGRQLSMTVLRDNNYDVWVYDLEREVATRLTFDDAYDADQLFTADGENIIFTSSRSGVQLLYIKRADGSGDAQLLVDGDHDMWAGSMTTDGKWLAIETQNAGLDIVTMRMDGSGEIEPFLTSEFSERFPSFSPDGRWIAYQSNESGQAQIYVRPFPAAAGKWQVSIDGGFWPRWSPDGRELYYSVQEGLMVVPVVDSADTFRAGKATPLITGTFRGAGTGINIGSFLFSSYDVAPDGRFVMFPGEETAVGDVKAVIVFNWLTDLQRTRGGK